MQKRKKEGRVAARCRGRKRKFPGGSPRVSALGGLLGSFSHTKHFYFAILFNKNKISERCRTKENEGNILRQQNRVYQIFFYCQNNAMLMMCDAMMMQKEKQAKI